MILGKKQSTEPPQPRPAEFEAWLDVATSVCPERIQATARKMLINLFEERVRELQSQGATLEQAQTTELAALGDPHDKIRRMKETIAECKRPTKLATWLAVATVRLLPADKARICAEIEEHYNAAVQASLLCGAAESDAHAAALADLGNARASGRRFRAECLTQGDVEYLDSYFKSGRSSFILSMSGYVLGLLFAGLLWILHLNHQLLPDYFPDWVYITVWIVWVLAGMALRLYRNALASRPRTPATVRRMSNARLMRDSHHVLLYFAVLGDLAFENAHAMSSSDNAFINGLVLFMIVFCCFTGFLDIRKDLRVHMKLRSLGDDNMTMS